MIPPLYPRFTSGALNVHGGPLARSPPPARRDTHLCPHTQACHRRRLHPRSRHRLFLALTSLAALIAARCTAKRRRGYPTLRECSAIPWKCEMRDAATCSLARNSQTNRPTTRLERHGRPTARRTRRQTLGRSIPCHNRPGARQTAPGSRRDRWTQNPPGRPRTTAQARATDLNARVRPPAPQTSPREASRVCLFPAPSTTLNGAPKMTSSNRQSMRVFPPRPDAVRLRASSRLVPPFQVSTISTGTHTL